VVFISTCHNQNVLVRQAVRADSFAYDAVGTRTGRGVATQTGNRLTSFDGYTMTYDDDGNLTSKTVMG
jgi:hypothetical protein